MEKLPRIFFFTIGLGIGILAFWLIQKAGVVSQKPLCDNLELQLDLMRLQSKALQLKINQQDSIIFQFQELMINLDNSNTKEK